MLFKNNLFIFCYLFVFVSEDVQVTSKAKESAAETIKPEKLQSSVPASVSTSNSISAASEQECLTQEQTSLPKIVAKPQKDLQSTKNQTAKSVGENSNKQNHQSSSVSSVAQSSKEGLKLISSLKDVEQPKHSANQTQADEAPSSRVQKNSKRKGSASSTGALSDIIQDIRISPREAKMAGDNTPTKGIYSTCIYENIRMSFLTTNVWSMPGILSMLINLVSFYSAASPIPFQEWSETGCRCH